MDIKDTKPIKTVHESNKENNHSQRRKTAQYSRNLPQADKDMFQLDRYEHQMLEREN